MLMTAEMGWGMMVAGLLLLVGALALVVFGAAWLADAIGRSDRPAPSAAAPTAIEVLQHRYAQGAIDDDELAHRLAKLDQ